MAVVPMPLFLSQPLSRSRKRVIMMAGAGIPSMRYFNPRLAGSEKPPKPKRRFAAWSAASLIVAVMFLTAGNAGAQQSSAVDTAAATRHLFEAVHGNSMAAVQSSIAAGADLSATNEWGVTAIDLAVDKGYFSIAHFLLSVRNLRRLEEKPKPSPIPPAASAATESQPVLPPVKPWAATVEPSPKVSRQTAPAGTEAPGDAQSQTAPTPAPDHIPSVAATTQSRTDGKPDPFDPSTAFPADDLPIIGKIRRRPKIPEAAAPEASPPESAVPGASKAVKPSTLNRFTDTVSGFFRGKEEAGETAPAGGQPIPETKTRADQPELPVPAAAPEGEDKSRAGPVSAIPETPAPLASSEDSVAAPADKEPKEGFLMASISKRITDLFSTREEEKTAAEEATEETAFPSQSETDFESVRSESETEPTPQAADKTATGESAGIAVEQQAKGPPASVETAASGASEPEPPAPAPEAASESEDKSRAGPASATPETPAPLASNEDSVAAREDILDYEAAAPADEEPKKNFLLAGISKRITGLFATREEEKTVAEEAAEETAFPANNLPIIGKIRRRPEIPEATASSPPPASKGFQLPTANRTEPAEGAAPEASPPESAVPGASKAVKPSALNRFTDTVSGFFRSKEEAGETAPAGGQPIPETETRADQPEPPAPAPEAASESEDTSWAGPASETPETPVPLASSEDSAATQEDILDYEAAAPADEEPEEPKKDFLLAGISKRITDLFATREEEKTVAEEAAEETAFPSQSETDFKSVRSESEAEPTPQAAGETATGESAGIAVEQQAKEPPAPVETAAKSEDTSRAGPDSATPETPVPLASNEDSVAAQKDILDYEAAAPADEEPEENFLLAGISKRITDLFATREEEKTVAEEAVVEMAFPSQSETDFESVRSESEAEPTPQAAGETATGENAGIAVEQQAKEPLAPVETATLSAEPPAPAPEAASESEDISRAGPASATPEMPAPLASSEDSVAAKEDILDYEAAAPADEEPEENFLLAGISKRITGLFATREEEKTVAEEAVVEMAFPSKSETDFESVRSESEAEPTPQAAGETATGENAGIAVEQQAKKLPAPIETATPSALESLAPVETATLIVPEPEPPAPAAAPEAAPEGEDTSRAEPASATPETPAAGKSPAKSPATNADEAAEETAAKSAAPESRPAKTAAMAKKIQKPSPAEETVKSRGFIEKLSKYFRPDEQDKAQRQAPKAEPDVDVHGDEWSVSDVQTARVSPSRQRVKASPVPQTTRYLTGKSLAIGQSVRLGSPPRGVTAIGRKTCIEKRGGALLFCVVPVDWPSIIDPYFQVGSIMYKGSKAIARYDNGAATNFHALFPSGSYEAIIQYFTNRYGQPTKTLMRSIAPLAAPRRENPTAMWQSIDTTTKQISTLEVRKFDDGRGGFPDTKRGVVMLYQQWSSPIFPHVSMIELMLLDRQG